MRNTNSAPLVSWTAHDIPRGARVLLRIEANVPVVHGKVSLRTDGRIARTLPEIRRLLRRDVRLILMTHLGRPSGVDGRYGVAPVARALSQLIGKPITVAKDVVGKDASARVAALAPGDVLMLENLRFDDGEESNSIAFAKKLAAFGDVYVNNAFGVCHRAHASVAAITAYLPSFPGELLVREVAALTQPIAHPFVLVVGGIKLETKLPLLRRLGGEADRVLVGSAIADELAHHPKLRTQMMKLLGDRLQLPLDLARDADRHAFDVGKNTIALFPEFFAGAQTIIWNGPFGAVEHAAGRKGTVALIRALSKLRDVRIVVGGGETVDMVEQLHATRAFSWVSTGGGAMLALLAGERMPGIAALQKTPQKT